MHTNDLEGIAAALSCAILPRVFAVIGIEGGQIMRVSYSIFIYYNLDARNLGKLGSH